MVYIYRIIKGCEETPTLIVLKLAIPNLYEINGINRSGLVPKALALHILGISYAYPMTVVLPKSTRGSLLTNYGKLTMRQPALIANASDRKHIGSNSFRGSFRFGLLSGSNDPASWLIQPLGPCLATTHLCFRPHRFFQ